MLSVYLFINLLSIKLFLSYIYLFVAILLSIKFLKTFEYDICLAHKSIKYHIYFKIERNSTLWNLQSVQYVKSRITKYNLKVSPSMINITRVFRTKICPACKEKFMYPSPISLRIFQRSSTLLFENTSCERVARSIAVSLKNCTSPFCSPVAHLGSCYFFFHRRPERGTSFALLSKPPAGYIVEFLVDPRFIRKTLERKDGQQRCMIAFVVVRFHDIHS